MVADYGNSTSTVNPRCPLSDVNAPIFPNDDLEGTFFWGPTPPRGLFEGQAADPVAKPSLILLPGLLCDAALWQAQVRAWQQLDVATWRPLVTRAFAQPEHLSPRERTLASALALMADAKLDEACRTYDSLKTRNRLDFTAWFGIEGLYEVATSSSAKLY